MNIKRNIVFALEKRKKDGVPVIENVPIRMRVIYQIKGSSLQQVTVSIFPNGMKTNNV